MHCASVAVCCSVCSVLQSDAECCCVLQSVAVDVHEHRIFAARGNALCVSVYTRVYTHTHTHTHSNAHTHTHTHTGQRRPTRCSCGRDFFTARAAVADGHEHMICGGRANALCLSHSVLQCVAVCGNVLPCVAVWCSVVPCVAVWCSVVPCVAVCCSVLKWTCTSI